MKERYFALSEYRADHWAVSGLYIRELQAPAEHLSSRLYEWFPWRADFFLSGADGLCGWAVPCRTQTCGVDVQGFLSI